MSAPPQITVASTEVREDRFSRFRLIPWWNEDKLRQTRCLVIGAGALGNEILKNLALLGFQKIVVVDLDRIEESNLSRSVLYRTQDVGQFKANAAAHSFKAMSPDAMVQPLVANILHECGLGLFQWSDIILAGLDNREARLFINRAAWKMNRPWVDGAIEGINGVARVFIPGVAPCYECTLGETDWALLERRMSCNLLAREEDTAGKVPTTPTISSIIAGVEVQEAVKLIHGLPTLASRGYIFEGLNHTSYVVEYTENPDCMSHYTIENLVSLPQRSRDITLAQLFERAQHDLSSSEVVVEFSRDIIHKLTCPGCHKEEECFAPVGSISYQQGKCPHDGQMRVVTTLHSYSGARELGSRKLNQLGLPLFDVFTARTAEREIGYLIAGDESDVLTEIGTESCIMSSNAMSSKTKMKAKAPSVLVSGEVLRRIRQHARSQSKTEVCGILIGDEVEGQLQIHASIQGVNAAQAGTHVTFTQDTWEHIYKVKDSEYPDARIIGWYHSHPGFGVFLSDHDTFIHKNFFSSPQQVAWVYDPHSDEEGCFGWVGTRLERLPQISVADGKGGEEAGETGKPEPMGFADDDDEAQDVKLMREDSAPDQKSAPDWLRWSVSAASYLAIFAVGFLVAWMFFPHVIGVPVDPFTGQPIQRFQLLDRHEVEKLVEHERQAEQDRMLSPNGADLDKSSAQPPVTDQNFGAIEHDRSVAPSAGTPSATKSNAANDAKGNHGQPKQ